ncbi:hypothetical protein NBRC110019_22080 [Neptunitalea chrysea]|uniref:Uncharacterized protein n=1 Tax=Neptunitalea chrysea TaxID=1647581 RepID=A0A9W6EWL7_9FLAO|nr:carboxypeptidase-like regulatory domain-containing protein [Neptunitalea chrysea]GLB53168.1 hypothetical protein NBRC110019_22080 [Neptunitalea chrysea]
MQHLIFLKGFYKGVLFVIILFFTSVSLYGQEEILFKGTVTDNLANPLPYTNVIVSPEVPNGKVRFGISDNEGKFKISVPKDSLYMVEITHLGFQKITDTISTGKEITKSYVLLENTTALEAVVIEQKIPMLVKEDTIVYRVDNFVTGKEHKLREVLKTLPGVEVDKLGNVTVNGKKVTKLLVEGNTFFTGDSKLAVNNIPADAVAEVEVLDNYNEVSFLKGLSDSDEMALNVKLKEGKKNFVFGDIHTGVGYKERYLLNPALFYYSKKFTANVIGDVNNIGAKSFTLSDYIEFEGGYAKLLDRPKEYREMLSAEFVGFLKNEDFTSQQNNFGAASISSALGKKARLEVFSINNKTKETTLYEKGLTYISTDNIVENRTNSEDNRSVFGLHKIKVSYTPNLDTDIRSTTIIKNSNADGVQKLISYVTDSTFTRSESKPKGITFQQNVTYNKQLSFKHTLSTGVLLNYLTHEKTSDWQFSMPVLNSLIPFEYDDDSYNLVQNQRLHSFKLQADIKEYWELSNFHHLYPNAGIKLISDTYTTEDAQVLADGSILNFQESGFNNDTEFKLFDTYAGIEYKVKIGDLIMKSGITYHNYDWELWQQHENSVNKSKGVLLPSFNLDYKISHSEKLHLTYTLLSNFSAIRNYATRYRLVNFNSVYQGNEDLENEMYHYTRVRYSLFDMYKGLFGSLSFSAKNNVRAIRNTSQITGIEVVQTANYSDLPENSYNFMGSISKNISKYRFGLSLNTNFSNFTRLVNTTKTDYRMQNYSYTARVFSRYKKGLNFQLGWNQRFYRLLTEDTENNVTQINPSGMVEYIFLSDFNAKLEYKYTRYQNKNYNSVTDFSNGDFSVAYAKEDSLWSFEIGVTNLFETNFKRDIDYSDYVITDTKTFIMPRIVMLKVNYKL